MKNLEEMLDINKQQANYYDSISKVDDMKEFTGYAKHEKANLFTKFWASLRYKQQDAFTQSGLEKIKSDFQEKWIQRKKGGDFLEIGCFRGTRFSWPLIEFAGNYEGIDLSSNATAVLQDKINAEGLEHKAKAYAKDFLLFSESKKYDLIFAHGVLHHFENPEPLFDKIKSILKDDGILILTEPSTVNVVFQLFRNIYRPFQSDAAWEWPFNKNTVSELNLYLKPIDGFGWGRRSLYLSILVGLPLVGRLVRPIYLKCLSTEISAGWNEKVWLNSTITAVYVLR